MHRVVFRRPSHSRSRCWLAGAGRSARSSRHNHGHAQSRDCVFGLTAVPESQPLFREALDERRRVQGQRHPSTANTSFALGKMFAAQGRVREAETVLVDAYDVRLSAFGNVHPSVKEVVSYLVQYTANCTTSPNPHNGRRSCAVHRESWRQLRLITWNLNARRSRSRRRSAALALRSPDILALQEVSRGMVEPLQRELSEVGFPHAIDSFAVAPSWEAKGPRRYGLMIAARFPLAPSPTDVSVCWPERMLSVVVATPSGPLLLHTTHIPPGSSNGPTKIAMIERCEM